MKKLILISLLLLSGCGCNAGDTACIEQENSSDKIYCTPELVTTAPDGTELYRVSSRCSKINSSHDVYFSKSGTQQTQFCGKGCSRPEIVPNSGGQQ